jgi:hypothetical protein
MHRLRLSVSAPLVLLLLLSVGPVVAGDVDTVWVRRYDGPASSYDYAKALAVDGFGNVYVTGSSVASGTGLDYATIKYYPDGDTAWVRRYNGLAGLADEATAIAVDASGNVYVTGNSEGDGTQEDYVTIKYFSGGDTAWVRRYNGPGNAKDMATAIAVDGSGNVCVTGYSIGSGSAEDYATIKYYSNGNVAWVKRYNGHGNAEDRAYDIDVDGSGSVYVTGYASWSSYVSYDYITIKYYANGDTAWVRRYDVSTDYAFDIAVDGSANVYVAGWVLVGGGDVLTIKYYPNGDTAWVRQYDGPSGGSDRSHDMTVDGSGNVYVTAESYGAGEGNTDYLVLKYYPDGDLAWDSYYDSPYGYDDYPYAIAVDDQGNAYATGISVDNYDYDFATVKFKPDGSRDWAVRYQGPPGGGYHWAWDVCVDGSGYVYVTGNGRGYETWDDFATIKYWQNTAPASFSLLSPADDDSILEPIYLYWESSTDPDPDDTVRYDAHLSRSIVFDPDSTMIFEDRVDTTLTDSLDVGDWYWKVKAHDKRGAYAWSSESWHFYVAPGFTHGDANGDGGIDLGDAIYLLNYLFKNDDPPEPLEAGDANCDGSVEIGDAIYLLNYLFKEGPPPGCP